MIEGEKVRVYYDHANKSVEGTGYVQKIHQKMGKGIWFVTMYMSNGLLKGKEVDRFVFQRDIIE